VFIGTSLEEPGLAAVIRRIVGSGSDVLKGFHIHLKSTEATEPDYVQSEGLSLGVIQQICYDKVDPDYSGLEFVLSQFSGEPVSSPIPRSEPTKFSIADDLDSLKEYGGKSK
jgi:hypothetical protein